MRTIEKDGIVLARHITSADIKPGLNFFSDDAEFIQVGSWEYEVGKELLPHIHNTVERTINRTYEVLHILNGRLEATIYTLDEVKAGTLILETGDTLVLLECGHSYRTLDDKTRVLEIKNGPYMGAETDRRRF